MRAALLQGALTWLLALGPLGASAPDRAAALAAIDAGSRQGPFQPEWESLQRFRTPDWYQDGKFGIFIHWGVYSVPAFGTEWYPRDMYRPGDPVHAHHVATYGPVDIFGYKDFIPLFKAQHFDPAAWAALFRKAGARYVVPVAEHHDGFAMYDTAWSDWSAAKMGPRRDVIGELAAAVRKEGLVFGLSSHRAEHWFFFGEGMKLPSDVRSGAYEGLYGPAKDMDRAEDGLEPPDQPFLEDWLLRSCELVDKYAPQVVYFDGWIGEKAFRPYLRTFCAYYYNRGAARGQQVAVDAKFGALPTGAGVHDLERGQRAGIHKAFWQTDTSVSKTSWGFVQHQDLKAPKDLIADLADIVAKNGALLLNIGPRADGTIPEDQQAILLAIGAWLDRNGEAIYGTRPWRVSGEGPTAVVDGPFNEGKRKPFTGEDIRFTAKGGKLYALVLADPGAAVTIRTLGAGSKVLPERVVQVELLGYPGALEMKRDAAGLNVALPNDRPTGAPLALRITLTD